MFNRELHKMVNMTTPAVTIVIAFFGDFIKL
jgi:hypothetical protein